eukprot:488165_1
MSCYQLNSSLGFSVTKQNNIDLIEDDKLLFIVGNTIQILNINSTENNYGKFNDNHIVIHGHSNGIGAFAIHPTKQCFAFGEIGPTPDIYIYDYPQLKQQQKLSNGTQRKYNDMEFNVTGNYLATIGASPDHMLTIWDWKLGSVILRAKAFSQDVFNVRFSPYNQNRLITSGTGHIRFWEMAQTFTGLKLQGKIGKFGEIDLSDVWSFVEFPCGKILSGSEHGNILMWQSDLIQFVAQPNEDEACHRSNIIYVDILKETESMTLISAGSDGVIKFWECDDIEYFEPSDDLRYYPLQLKHEITVNANAQLMSIIKYQDLYWMIQDAMGNVYKLWMNEEYSLRSVMQFHGLYVTSIACGDKSHDAITSGKDGTIRHWNLETQRCDYMKQMQSPVNVMLPFKETCFMLFCEDGVVRVIEAGKDSFFITYSLRIHDEAIVSAAISSNSQYLATVTDKQLFFSEIRHDNEEEDIVIEPIGFVCLGEKLNDIHWSADNAALLSHTKQEIVTYQRPKADAFDTSSSFEIELRATVTRFTPLLPVVADAPPRKEVDEKEEVNEKEEENSNIFDGVEWEISCILPCVGRDTAADVLIAISCPTTNNSNYYEWNIGDAKMIEFHATHLDDAIARLSYSNSFEFLLISSEQSTVQIRDVNDDERYVNIGIHSGWDDGCASAAAAALVSLSFDNRLVLSSSCDGSMFCHLFDAVKLKHGDAWDANFDFDYIASDAAVSIKNKSDMKDHGATDYSVQGEKIQRELDSAKSAAERYKTQLRQELHTIRARKEEIVRRAAPFVSSSHDFDFDIDKNLRSTMARALEKDVGELKDQMAWESARIAVGLNKLEDAFLNTVTVENVEVSSFRSCHTVSTFRTPVLPQWIEKDIAAVHQIINAESHRAEQLEAKMNASIDANASLKMAEEEEEEKDAEEEEEAHEEEEVQRLSASKQKKIIREKLKNALEELQLEKPDENADDPRDIEAIDFATAHIGDYKLKSDGAYVVPEDEHMNASQKRKQMILLLESVAYIKMGLNQRVLALRDLKQRIIQNIGCDTARLNEIKAELLLQQNEESEIEAPTMEPCPRMRYDFSKKDLIEFERTLQEESQEEEKKNAFGGGGAMKKEKEEVIVAAAAADNSAYCDRLATVERSALEGEECVGRRAQLEYEWRVVFDKMNSTMNTFDMALSELRREKCKLMNDLKLTDFKFFTLFKELKVLRQFEDREIGLNGKLLKCRTEKAQVVVDLTETQERLSSKLEEIRLWQEKDETIQREFVRIVGQRNPFFDELKKIFSRKMKKKKKKNDEAEECDKSDSSDDDDDDDSSCSDDDEEEEEAEDIM